MLPEDDFITLRYDLHDGPDACDNYENLLKTTAQ